MSSLLMKCNLTEEEWPKIFMEFDGALTQEEEGKEAEWSTYCPLVTGKTVWLVCSP